jgi:hypothetical protein
VYVLKDYPAWSSSIICRQEWHKVIQQYSERKLTIEDDKLPAMAGLARRFALETVSKNGTSIPGNRYLAGLWWDNIIQDMCWTIHKLAHSGERLRRYRAPTWSWASVNGVVRFVDSETDLAVVQEAHVDLDTLENPLGRVTGGWIWLRALRLRPQRKDDDISGRNIYLFEDGVDMIIFPEWDAETHCAPNHGEKVDPVKGETDLFLIPLAWSKSHRLLHSSYRPLNGPFFLIVKAADHQVTSHVDMPGFQRVGCGLALLIQQDGIIGIDSARHLIIKKWTVAKERGELEDMIVF